MGAPWITTEDIKARMANLDPRGTHVSDVLKDELADRACAWVERECAIQVLSDPAVSHRFRFNGNGKGRLHLPFNPVNSISLLKVNQSPVVVGTSSDWADGLAQAYFDERSVYYPPGFSRGVANVLVEWLSGWTLATVPMELKSLAEAVAILMFKERDRWGDQSKNLPSQTVSFVRDLPPQEAQTLRSMKDHRRYFEGFGGVPA